jgi:transposase InsO family protein
MRNLVRFRRHSGHGWTCRWVAPVANDPKRSWSFKQHTCASLWQDVLVHAEQAAGIKFAFDRLETRVGRFTEGISHEAVAFAMAGEVQIRRLAAGRLHRTISFAIDCAYGDEYIRRLCAMGIRDRPTAPQSPWQNAYAERLIGSMRREVLGHVAVLGERHLRHLLLSYMTYYNEARTHLSLDKEAPIPRQVQGVGRIYGEAAS